jgi:hypothetical protein
MFYCSACNTREEGGCRHVVRTTPHARDLLGELEVSIINARADRRPVKLKGHCVVCSAIIPPTGKRGRPASKCVECRETERK